MGKQELVRLRLMTAGDTAKIVAWRNRDFVRNNFIYQELFTEEGHLRWIREQVEPGYVVQFIICLADGREIGSVYFRDIDREKGTAEYGIFIGEDDAAGCAFGSETCLLACEYGFSVEKWHKIILRAFSDNQAAIRSYEKAGFVREAYLKDEVCIDGTYRDMVLMGFINPEERKG